MADTADSIFNKKATEKLRSPDDLDMYVRVTHPSIWIVLAACATLLIGLFAWGVFGTVTTSVVTTGTSVGGDWVYVVRFAGDGDYGFTEGISLDINITTERIAPISLMLGGAS